MIFDIVDSIEVLPDQFIQFDTDEISAVLQIVIVLVRR